MEGGSQCWREKLILRSRARLDKKRNVEKDKEKMKWMEKGREGGRDTQRGRERQKETQREMVLVGFSP